MEKITQSESKNKLNIAALLEIKDNNQKLEAILNEFKEALNQDHFIDLNSLNKFNLSTSDWNLLQKTKGESHPSLCGEEMYYDKNGQLWGRSKIKQDQHNRRTSHLEVLYDNLEADVNLALVPTEIESHIWEYELETAESRLTKYKHAKYENKGLVSKQILFTYSYQESTLMDQSNPALRPKAIPTKIVEVQYTNETADSAYILEYDPLDGGFSILRRNFQVEIKNNKIVRAELFERSELNEIKTLKVFYTNN